MARWQVYIYKDGEVMQGIEHIGRDLPEVAAEIRANGGFLTEQNLAALAGCDATRLINVLVRCDGGRFVTAAQCASHFMNIIANEKSDRVRDVSLPR